MRGGGEIGEDGEGRCGRWQVAQPTRLVEETEDLIVSAVHEPLPQLAGIADRSRRGRRAVKVPPADAGGSAGKKAWD